MHSDLGRFARRPSATKPTKGTESQKFRIVSVTSGRDCVGHIVCRGKLGFEAFDRDDVSLGIFRDMQSAANAIVECDDGGEVGT